MYHPVRKNAEKAGHRDRTMLENQKRALLGFGNRGFRANGGRAEASPEMGTASE